MLFLNGRQKLWWFCSSARVYGTRIHVINVWKNERL